MNTYNVILLGACGVGKSAISVFYVLNKFPEEYDPTLEDVYRKQLIVYGRIVELRITDTSGASDYEALRPDYMAEGDGFIVVYSTTNIESFTRAEEIVALIKVHRPGAPVILVGNKNDDIANRQVTYIDGAIMAKNLHVEFVEIAAYRPTEAKDVFEKMAKLLVPLPIVDNTKCLCNSLIITIIILIVLSMYLIYLLI